LINCRWSRTRPPLAEVVSSSGRFGGDFDHFGDAADFELEVDFEFGADVDLEAGAERALEPRELDGYVVARRLEKVDLVIAGAVGHDSPGLVSGRVGNHDRRARYDGPLRVGNGSSDAAACLLPESGRYTEAEDPRASPIN
jgi:hypothetical protein